MLDLALVWVYLNSGRLDYRILGTGNTIGTLLLLLYSGAATAQPSTWLLLPCRVHPSIDSSTLNYSYNSNN